MTVCANCGAPLPANNAFCTNCGARAPQVASAAGSVQPVPQQMPAPAGPPGTVAAPILPRLSRPDVDPWQGTGTGTGDLRPAGRRSLVRSLIFGSALALVLVLLAVNAVLLRNRQAPVAVSATVSTTPTVAPAPQFITVTVTPTLDPAELALVQKLDGAAYFDCRSAWHEGRDVVAAVSCRASDPAPDSLLVMRFKSRSTMDAYMKPSYSASGAQCVNGRYANTWFYNSNPKNIRGKLNCFTAAGSARVVWSHNATDIVVVATGRNLSTLYAWWTQVSKPDQ